MEYLLAMQPIANELYGAACVLIVFSLIGVFVSYLSYLVISMDSDALDPKSSEFHTCAILLKSLSMFKRVSIVLGIVMLLALPAARSWDIYKNVLAYRAINSKTTTKAIENANVFMDKVQKFLVTWNPKEKE